MKITILLHSSKTMVITPTIKKLSTPMEMDKAIELRNYLASLTVPEIQSSMHIKEDLAIEVKDQYQSWSATNELSAAVECFRGDIYSGLRALEFSTSEAEFAQNHLVLLSGLYGHLKPYDGIRPYRLEAGYRMPDARYKNLYQYWGESIAKHLPSKGLIVNVSSIEYDKFVLPYVESNRVITPRFLSLTKRSQEPKFVVVHAKIARGAFARWLIKNEMKVSLDLEAFNDLGYRFIPQLSQPSQPVFVCENFQGIGLSQRLVPPNNQ